jgi:18S rRNA (guanine1575-N7)-methyltransferase
MSRKWSTPKFPDSYIGESSKEYSNSIWMERNQKMTTLSCVAYLYDEKLDELGKLDHLTKDQSLILDMGCGTGFSSEILVSQGFRVIAVDILIDMIYKAAEKRNDYEEYNSIDLILADINFLPLRDHIFEVALSVSAYNFIISDLDNKVDQKKRLNKTAAAIFDILKSKGRIVIEFYPANQEELELFNASFTTNGFDGFLIKKKETQQSGQTFLLLKKAGESQ